MGLGTVCQEMGPNTKCQSIRCSQHPYHSGDYTGFRSSVSETGNRERERLISYCFAQRVPVLFSSILMSRLSQIWLLGVPQDGSCEIKVWVRMCSLRQGCHGFQALSVEGARVHRCADPGMYGRGYLLPPSEVALTAVMLVSSPKKTFGSALFQLTQQSSLRSATLFPWITAREAGPSPPPQIPQPLRFFPSWIPEIILSAEIGHSTETEGY